MSFARDLLPLPSNAAELERCLSNPVWRLNSGCLYMIKVKGDEVLHQGGGGERVDLSGADLRSAGLNGADLRRADLRSADLRRADLSGADLRGADLSGAHLRRADLRGAHLSGAHLYHADLSGADLSGADLSCADLRRADLSGADLSGAELWDVTGNKKEIFTFQTNKYAVVIYQDHIQIGCKNFSQSEWFNFSDDEISKMDSGALDWWCTHKQHVKIWCEMVNSYSN